MTFGHLFEYFCYKYGQLFFPTLYFARNAITLTVHIDGIATLALLTHIVAQEKHDRTGEKEHGEEVAERHEAHGDVGKVPCCLKRGDGSEEHYARGKDAVDEEHHAVVGEEAEVGLSVVVVAEYGAEGKEQDGDGDVDAAYAAYLLLK